MRDADSGRPQDGGPGAWRRPDSWPPFESAAESSSYPLGSPPNPRPHVPPTSGQAPSSTTWPPFESLTWRQFEVACAEAFRAQGYSVTLTPDGADGGVDLVLERPGERVIVQCKHWAAWKVGVKTVRELLGVMTAVGVPLGIVVTSGRYTDEARRFAMDVPVRLLDGRDVAAMLVGVPVPASFAAVSSPETAAQTDPHGATHGWAHRAEGTLGGQACPRCGEPMVMRTATRGNRRGERFWGCPRYPACRGVAGIAGSPTHDRSAPPPPGARPIPGPPPPAARRRRKRKRPVLRALLAVGAVVIGLAIMPTAIRSGISALQGAATLPIAAMNPTKTVAAPPAVATTPVEGATPLASAPIVDPSGESSIAVAERPHQVAVDSAGGRLFVTNREANSITVVDLASRTQAAQWPVERQPLGIAFDPVEATLWVTNYNDSSVTVLTPGGEHLGTVAVGRGPESIAIDAVRRRAYVVNSVDRTVSVVDLTSVSVQTTQDLRFAASGIAVDTVQGRVCMVHPQVMRMLHCYDEDLERAGTLGSVGDLVAIDPVRHDWYGVRKKPHSLSGVDFSTGEKVELALDHVPTGIAVDPATRLVYVALPDAGEILVLSPLS